MRDSSEKRGKGVLEIYLVISETNRADQLCDGFLPYSCFKANAAERGPVQSTMNSDDHVSILNDALVFFPLFIFSFYFLFPLHFFTEL